METSQHRLLFAGLTLLIGGCASSPGETEKAQRRHLEKTADALRLPASETPPLTAETSPEAWLRHALLRNPAVLASYLEWSAAVHRIPSARTPPDPRLTLQLDITRVVEAVMPGIMAEFPGPGKLAVAGDIASAESEAARQRFRAAVLDTAFALRSAGWSLRARRAKLELLKNDLALLRAEREAAVARTAAGKSGLREPLRVESAVAELELKIADLDDMRDALAARLAQAVGERSAPEPRAFLPSPPMNPDTDGRLDTATAANPLLAGRRADIARAEAELALARKATVPDFSLSGMTDVRRGLSRDSLTRAEFGITLPVRRERIRENITAAEAALDAARARAEADALDLVAAFAEARFAAREADRRLRVIDGRLLPLAETMLQATRTDYAAGGGSLAEPLTAARSLLALRLEREDLLLARDLALAKADLLLAAPPPGAPPIPAEAD